MGGHRWGQMADVGSGCSPSLSPRPALGEGRSQDSSWVSSLWGWGRRAGDPSPDSGASRVTPGAGQRPTGTQPGLPAGAGPSRRAPGVGPGPAMSLNLHSVQPSFCFKSESDIFFLAESELKWVVLGTWQFGEDEVSPEG